ncbi:MAG: metallophosphoesterase [Anaerolineaceae bacterium]|nr:metallophosphoesterase [Anaerolineaceae bacterium]
MKRRQIFTTIILVIIAFSSGIFVNEQNFFRAYWKTKTMLNDISIINPALAKKIFPNFVTTIQNKEQSLNEIPLQDNRNPLSFFVAGHVYGNINKDEFHPSMSLVTNVQRINELNPDMVVLLGDMVMKSTNREFLNVEDNLLGYFTMPVFNVVGNHDVLDRKIYENRYGKTVYSFIFKNYLFLFLDSNQKICKLTEEQYQFISDEISAAESQDSIEGIHLFVHHVLFMDYDAESKEKIFSPNSDCGDTNAFTTFIDEVLVPLSKQVPIYIYSGDVGANQSRLSPYYETIPGESIYMFATGLGNSEDDSALYVHEEEDQLIVSAYSLKGKEMLPIERYDFSYWETQKAIADSE